VCNLCVAAVITVSSAAFPHPFPISLRIPRVQLRAPLHIHIREHKGTMASSSAAAGLLARQLKQMQNDKSISGISCGLVDNNVFEWEVMLMIDDDTKFYGGTDPDIVFRSYSSSANTRQEVSSARASPSPANTPSSHQRCASRRPSSTLTVRLVSHKSLITRIA